MYPFPRSYINTMFAFWACELGRLLVGLQLNDRSRKMCGQKIQANLALVFFLVVVIIIEFFFGSLDFSTSYGKFKIYLPFGFCVDLWFWHLSLFLSMKCVVWIPICVHEAENLHWYPTSNPLYLSAYKRPSIFNLKSGFCMIEYFMAAQLPCIFDSNTFTLF